MTYYEFVREFRTIEHDLNTSSTFDSKLYSRFRKYDDMIQQLEKINDKGYLKFLQCALSFNGKVFGAVKDDPVDDNYLEATLKNWRSEGKVDVKLYYPKEMSDFLYMRMYHTLLGSGTLGEHVFTEPRDKDADDEAFEGAEVFLKGRLTTCYHDVMRCRWIDFDEGKGVLRPWDYYLTVPDNADGVGVIIEGGLSEE